MVTLVLMLQSIDFPWMTLAGHIVKHPTLNVEKVEESELWATGANIQRQPGAYDSSLSDLLKLIPCESGIEYSNMHYPALPLHMATGIPWHTRTATATVDSPLHYAIYYASKASGEHKICV
ncbi:hypothetical protein QAD02_017584 [Eretmocerus hayati]|uniref:Uncharacterized protein n=1 Tax=Eretmocerus hayati TaxID=131215 RepID=A0ACC2PHA0_9HYME|nr:hypothetical protein QAD02_017584 [Eretmocerus hayati]